MVYKINSKLCLYADDSNLLISTESSEQTEICTFVELETIGNFFQTHNLRLNPQKTNFVHFKTSQNKSFKEPMVIYDSQNIEGKKLLT